MKRAKTWLKRSLMSFLVVVLVLLFLFLCNGWDESWMKPGMGERQDLLFEGETHTIRVMAFNVAKCFAYTGITQFSSVEDVKKRLDRIAELITQEKVDLVFLSEIVNECGPRPIDQVAYLAERCGVGAWASSDNYSFGIPGFRLRSGNAILSRFPLRPIETKQLVGNTSIWNPTNNRRLLFCEVTINGVPLLIGSVRNDSFDLKNNLAQVESILKYIQGRPALLAGDFNAEPHDPSMKLLRESGLFSGAFDGPPTYPAQEPRRRIDFVLGPKNWKFISERILETDVSDHLPVLAEFGLHR